VKSADTEFGNEHIFDMENSDESSRRIGWFQNEFSHSLSLQPTPVGRCVSRQAGIDITGPARFSSPS
jgi:hypothetical protein